MKVPFQILALCALLSALSASAVYTDTTSEPPTGLGACKPMIYSTALVTHIHFCHVVGPCEGPHDGPSAGHACMLPWLHTAEPHMGAVM